MNVKDADTNGYQELKMHQKYALNAKALTGTDQRETKNIAED